MKKTLVGIFITSAVILLSAYSFFSLYSRFAIDYTLENLKMAIEASHTAEAAQVDSLVFRSTLKSLAIEEITRKGGDSKRAALLDDAARAFKGSGNQVESKRAEASLSEVFEQKSRERNFLLRTADTFYFVMKNLKKSVQPSPPSETKELPETAMLILSEAEKTESKWKLREAEEYYREFLERFSGRAEEGFVKISLAHLLMKMGRLGEAEEILKSIVLGYPNMREETAAASFLERLGVIRERLTRLPALEEKIKADPDLILTEEGGLELALSYLATYQLERATSVLNKLSEARDPRLRTKALFYLGWIREWRGDMEAGTLFEALKK